MDAIIDLCPILKVGVFVHLSADHGSFPCQISAILGSLIFQSTRIPLQLAQHFTNLKQIYRIHILLLKTFLTMFTKLCCYSFRIGGERESVVVR